MYVVYAGCECFSVYVYTVDGIVITPRTHAQQGVKQSVCLSSVVTKIASSGPVGV